MKILIAGGAGFIGSHIADRMLEAGHRVMVIDNFSSGSRSNNAPHPNLTVVEETINNYEAVMTLTRTFAPDVLIHAAYEPIVHPVSEYRDVVTSCLGTINLIDAAKAAGVRRIIYFQTVLIYGAVTSTDPLKVNHPVDPRSSYAISKLCAEHYIRQSGIGYTVFRLANHYGPRNLTGAFPVFYKKLKAGETCTIVDERRTFVFVSDLVDLVQTACDIDAGYPSGAYHVSTDEDYSIADIFRMVNNRVVVAGYEHAAVHKYVKSDDNGMKVMRLDWTETSRIFDWEPKVTLEEGIRRTIEWYEKNGVDRTFTHCKQAT
jgi:UDP-glucose 4-epimerase